MTPTEDWESLCCNIDRLNLLAIDRWIHLVNFSSTLRRCIKHNTLFDLNEEPCWQCFDEVEDSNISGKFINLR